MKEKWHLIPWDSGWREQMSRGTDAGNGHEQRLRDRALWLSKQWVMKWGGTWGPGHGEFTCKGPPFTLKPVWNYEDMKLRWYVVDFRRQTSSSAYLLPHILQVSFQCHFLGEASPAPVVWLNALAVHSHGVLYFSFINLVSLFPPPKVLIFPLDSTPSPRLFQCTWTPRPHKPKYQPWLTEMLPG